MNLSSVYVDGELIGEGRVSSVNCIGGKNIVQLLLSDIPLTFMAMVGKNVGFNIVSRNTRIRVYDESLAFVGEIVDVRLSSEWDAYLVLVDLKGEITGERFNYDDES